MFAVFWLVTAWLDQVLITLVLCIVFGVVSDIVTKNMYSEDGQTAVEEKKEVVKELSVEEIKANNEMIWTQAEAEKEKEDEAAEVPPPLPSKDYQSGQDMDLLADKLSAVAARSEAVESSDEEREEETKEDVPSARQYNRTVSDEYNQNTSTIDFNKREAVIEEETSTVNETIDEDPVEVEGNNVYAKDSSDDEEEQKKIYAKDSSDEEEKKVYAKDSSDDDDYDYASREVNFDEDESETEEDDTEGSKKEDVSIDEMQATETKTLQDSKDDIVQDQKDSLDVVKADTNSVTQDAIQEIEHELKLDESKKENTTIQNLKEFLKEDKKETFDDVTDDVKLVTQDMKQEEDYELKLNESKKDDKDDMLSTFEDLKPEMKSVDDLVTF